VVVHAVGGWIALGAVLLGSRSNRYRTAAAATPPSSIPSWRWAPGF
jgi:ammonia channel protein AmtB